MVVAIIQLVVGSRSDLGLQSLLASGSAAGAPLSAVVKSGERMSGLVERLDRRVGRKHGEVAQYRFELSEAAATPEFYNGGDPTKLGQSQN